MTIVARRVRWALESAKTLLSDFSPMWEMALGEVVKALAKARIVANARNFMVFLTFYRAGYE
jgi:hypothetical protein